MRTVRLNVALGAALAAAALLTVHGASAADSATGGSGASGTSTGASAACSGDAAGADSDDLGIFNFGLDGVVGSARVTTVNNVVPPGTTAGINGQTTIQTARVTDYSIIASAGVHLTSGFGFNLRMPFEAGNLFSSPTRSDGGVGNLEISAVGTVNLAKMLNLELTLGVSVPTAGGHQIPDTAANVAVVQGGVDQSGYDRYSVQRAVSYSRGLEDDELFQPDHLGINPKIRLIIGETGKWRIDPWVKLDNLIATNKSYSFIGELIFGANFGVMLGDHVEPMVRVWANAPLTGADYNNPVAVVEPQLRFHFGDVSPYVGVILPFAGPITNPYDYGVRVGLTLAQFGEPPKPPSDRDGDCVLDTVDACPDVAGVKTDDPKTNGCPADADGDGIVDSQDACPSVPGVKTDDPKTNGCPADSDHDGILDAQDACPNVAGVKTDDPKTNGCPAVVPVASDRDKDGIADADDACPDTAGVKTDDPKTNGCPGDTDHDGIPDAQDACPTAPGPSDPDPKKNGCPLARVENGQVKISSQIKFKTGSAVILKDSQPIIDAVASILKEHSDIAHVRIEGHTDNKGNAKANMALSQKRAASVLTALVGVGIAKDRLTSEGHGQEMPIDSNTTEDGRANNRRVEFHIEGSGGGTK